MNKRKVQAQMQLDVSFVGNTTQLVKQLDSLPSKLHLNTAVTKQLGEGFEKSYKTTLAQLNKLSEGLSKPGLSAKQYTAFFDSVNLKIQDTSKQMFTLKKGLQEAYKSPINKQMLKDLEAYKKKLEEINHILANQKAAQTRQNTAKQKMKDELGLDYDVAGGMLGAIASRKRNKQDITKTQANWLERQGLDSKQLARALELLRQIEVQQHKIEGGDKRATELTGKKSASASQGFVTKEIGRLEARSYNSADLKEDLSVLSKMSPTINGVSDALNNKLGPAFDSSLAVGITNAEKMAEGMSTLNEVLSQFGIVLSAGTIVRAFKDMALAAFEFYKSLDSALNEIYVVSNLSIGAVNDLKTSFINMAKDTGMALDDVTRSAVLFYQQGLNTDEVMEMTSVTSQFAKVAGIDATDAADKLTAAVNGYCLAAEDASLVADKFNKVAAASAADINELSTAFSKAAAQANQAGVGMDNYLAYIATMVEATREAPENIGTSLKTIMSRMQQVKEAGTTEDGDTDVNQVETALKSVGVALRDTNGELRDLEDVFDELGPKWNSLDRNTQAYLGTIIAGTRQQSRFITLMQNWDRVLELSEESANSAGQQALMHAKAMESIESKLQQMQVAWQEFISNLTSSDVFKGLIEGVTNLINAVNSGSTPVVLLGTALGLVIKQATKLNTPIGKLFNKMGEGVGKIRALNKENIKLAAGFFSSQKKVNGLTSNILKHQKSITKLQKENKGLIKSQEDFQASTGLTHEELMKTSEAYRTLENSIQSNKDKMTEHGQEIANSKDKISTLTPELQKQTEAYDSVQSGLTSLSVGLAAMSAILPGFAGEMAGAASGIVMIGSAGAQVASTIVSSVVPIMQTMKVSFIGAIKEMDAAMTASVIGAIIQAIVLAIMGAITAIKALVEAFGNQDKKITEAVNNTGEALEKYNNALNKAKGAQTLLDKYEKLSKKLYKTTKEQEELNTTAQELGDALDIDVIEDAYGNLAVSIEQVEEAMFKLKEEAKEARKEMIETEQESIEKFDHNGNVDTFYEKYLKSYRSDIRNAVTDIETGIDTKDLKASSQDVQKIMTNLKDSIINNSAEMVEAFGGVGIKWSLTEDVDSMVEAINDANIDPENWNELYRTFDVLQESVNDFSYNTALERVTAAVNTWGEAAGLTTEQLNLMNDAIMNSLYGSSSLHKTMSKYQDIIDKYEGIDFTSRLEELQRQSDDAYNRMDTNGEWDGLNPFYQSEDEREYEAAENKLALLREEQQAYENIKHIDAQIAQGLEEGTDIYGYYVNLQEERLRLQEEYNIASYEELETARKMAEIIGNNFSENSAAKFDEVGMFDENAEALLEKMNDDGGLAKILGGFRTGDKQGTQALTDYLVDVINNTDDEELRKVAEEKLNNVFDNIVISGTMSWGDLHGELDSLSSDLRKMNNLMEEFNDAGGFALDTFADLCDILDGIDMAALFDAGKLDQFTAALENLELGFSASTGMITANGEALESLGDIQEAITQAKLQQTVASLEADRAALQSQIYGIEAEIAANTALIKYLKTCNQTEMKLTDIKAKGQSYYTDTMKQAGTLTAQQYQRMTEDSASWAKAGLTNAAALGEGIKKAMAGELGEGNLSAYLSRIIGKMTYSSTGSGGVLDVLPQNEQGQVEVSQAIAALEAYNLQGQNSIKEIYSQMKGIDSMIGLVSQMKNADLSKLGVKTDSGDKKEVEKYIGQLREIYNILNRIEKLDHRLSMLDSYADIAKGKQYGDLLRERLNYNEELVHQYEFLVSEQKQFTNGYRDFINSVEGLEGVFEFDKFGQIIINWEKYDALQDEVIDGQISMKEKADDVYDTFSNMNGELHDWYDTLLDYYSAKIELQEEMIDSYVDLEQQAADAIQEIYQKVLDARLEAIDEEKEALEELRQARSDDRKDQDNAKALSGLQMDIQRAMMDTSGASDIALIKAQQDMADKLEDIAEDKYSQMLDDIIEKLEHEQDELQNHFDDLFSNLEWLFSWLDADIMGNESALFELLQQSDEWQQTSEIEKQRTLEEWQTKFNSYADTVNDNEKGIFGIFDNITSTREKIADLEKTLVSETSKASSHIAETIAKWQSKVSSSQNKSSTSTSTTTSSGKNNKTYDTTTNYKPTITTPENPVDPPKDNTPASSFNVGDRVKTKENGPLAAIKSYRWQDNQFKQTGTKYVNVWGPAKDYFTITDKKYWDSKWWYKIGDSQDWYPGVGLQYKKGGMVYNTGPAWLDGTQSQPEAVLNALQTEHFIKFTNALDNMFSGGNPTTNTSSISIDTISFNVESMSSPEDGEAAFDVFVNKFKEIGSQSGIKIDSFKSRI